MGSDMENAICTAILLIFLPNVCPSSLLWLVSSPEDGCLRAQVKSIVAGRKHETPVTDPYTCYAG